MVLENNTEACSPLRMHLLVLGNVNAALLQWRVCILFVVIIRGGAFQSQINHISLLGGAGLSRMGDH